MEGMLLIILRNSTPLPTTSCHTCGPPNGGNTLEKAMPHALWQQLCWVLDATFGELRLVKVPLSSCTKWFKSSGDQTENSSWWLVCPPKLEVLFIITPSSNRQENWSSSWVQWPISCASWRSCSHAIHITTSRADHTSATSEVFSRYSFDRKLMCFHISTEKNWKKIYAYIQKVHIIYSLLVQHVSGISHWKTCQLLASESLERYSCSGCQLVQRNSQFSFPHPPLLALGVRDEKQLKMNDLKTSSRIESKRFWYAATLVCVVQQICFGISPPPLNHQVGFLSSPNQNSESYQINTLLSPTSHQVDWLQLFFPQKSPVKTP